ncbi:MAG: CbiX/SirB N-terminal domain-containing protein [Clostridia bacterium]
MKGIIILSHGSRQKSTENTLTSIVDMLKLAITDYEIEYGFMEFSDKTIESGLDALREKGIKEIVAVPYFLFDGIHIREDIPEEIAKYVEKYPEVTISMGKTLGADPRLAEILADRVREAL